jgi:SAM-dependent methyltransferase
MTGRVGASDESAGRAGFTDHFGPLAPRYAACRPAQPAAVIAWAASLAPRRGLAWDCGTGNGQAAIGLADAFERVVATDASAAQITHAVAHPRVSYRVARAEASGLPGGSVDLVAVAQALHWFDLGAFYAEVGRVAAPGAAIVAWAYGHVRVGVPEVDALLQELARETLAPDWPPEVQLVEEGYRTIPFPFPEVVSPRFELAAAWTLAQLLGYVRSWSATARHARRTGRDPVAEVEPRLLQAWGDPVEPLPIRWPIAVRAGHAP